MARPGLPTFGTQTWNNTLVNAADVTFHHDTLLLDNEQESYFSAYTWVSGDKAYITGGTHVVAGWYEVLSKVSDQSIELAEDITDDHSSPTDVAIYDIGRVREWTTIVTCPAWSCRNVLAANSGTTSVDVRVGTSGVVRRMAGGTTAFLTALDLRAGDVVQVYSVTSKTRSIHASIW